MKRIIKVVLAALMTVALAACGSSKSDMQTIKEKGKLVVGITDFAPMDYKDNKGNWIGFDADMATLFAKKLGVDVEFVEIEWDNKILELDNGSIDCVWNGMTLTDEVASSMAVSNKYYNNSQVVIVKASVADKYNTVDDIKGLTFAVESGSAGEGAVKDAGYKYNAVTSQANALMEVKSGNSDAAVIDYLMAKAMTGKGTSYADLTYTVSLVDEQYVVGFRKDSDLADELNNFFKDNYETMQKTAEKYDIADALIAQN